MAQPGRRKVKSEKHIMIGTSPAIEHLYKILLNHRVYGDFKLIIVYEAN